MNSIKIYCALIILLASLPSFAENIIIPIASQGQSTKQIPLKGMDRDQVIQQYGEPKSRSDSTGSPPISRWDYDNFIVILEYDHVVHSVRKHRPISKNR